jgi:hypothetical protein
MKNWLSNLYFTFIYHLANRIALKLKEVERFETWKRRNRQALTRARAISALEGSKYNEYQVYKDLKDIQGRFN